ncbi:MAG: PDZ domain-containing protein, partial [Armatimonadota bacterium]|nr:PDZ domain-containing protein [Armatimonadota bacterium]
MGWSEAQRNPRLLRCGAACYNELMEGGTNLAALVDSVEPGSLAAAAGILPGDEIVAINGQSPCDLIDYRFLVCDDVVELEVRREGRPHHFRLEKEPDESLGISFASAVFDGVRPCKNACLFCFVHQMPPGMRPSLYVEDDDYRLS